MANAREWQLRALTPIWTGRVSRIEERRRDGRMELREVIQSDRLISTGLLGSIRWWFEVLVRGLGGSACDPSGGQCRNRNRCVVCELFGCTGWARKFRFQVLAGSAGEALRTDAIGEKADFRLRFQPLRAIAPEEWALLDLTLRLIAGYGAIGGKTVLKPSDVASRAGQRHQDYGIIEIEQRANDGISRSGIEAHVRNGSSSAHGDFEWASLRNFWCVNGRYLARRSQNASAFNQVIGREEQKNRSQQIRSGGRQANQWLAGQQGESKKVFSFKRPARTFGFVKPGTVNLAEIRRRLRQAWPDLRDDEILTGDAILDLLLSDGAGRP